MKRLFAFLILGVLVYGGWMIYTNNQPSTSLNTSTGSGNQPLSLSLQDSGSTLASIESVLGASIDNSLKTVSSTLSDITDGKSEPIINNALSNFQKELSKLPEDQVKKFQYNYCRSIVEEYEKQSN